MRKNNYLSLEDITLMVECGKYAGEFEIKIIETGEWFDVDAWILLTDGFIDCDFELPSCIDMVDHDEFAQMCICAILDEYPTCVRGFDKFAIDNGFDSAEEAIEELKSINCDGTFVDTYNRYNDRVSANIKVSGDAGRLVYENNKRGGRRLNESNERYWLGIKGVKMIWHGEWNDPELEYDGKRCNLYDVEDGMYSYMKERIADGEDWGNPENEEDFRNFCRAHADSVKGDIIDLYDAMHEEENTLTEEELDEWWGNLGFEEMELATGYDFTDFDPEDGHQEFVDVCDEWWEELSYEEKIGVYNEVMR